jgi:AcrR family transcriptional regulator
MPDTSRNFPHDGALVATRRRQIFEAACRVLSKKSFHEATVREIALEAGLAAGSIYVYLQSKDEILILTAQSMLAEMIEALPAIRERANGDPRRELLEVMRTELDVIDRYRDAFAVFHHEIRYLARRPEHEVALNALHEQYHGVMAAPLERGRETGTIDYSDLRSVVHLVHMLCAGWAMGVNHNRMDKETYWREISSLIEGRLFAPPSDTSVDSTALAAPQEG